MIALELHQRIPESKDWATSIFVISLLLIVIAKSTFEGRFTDYIKLLVSDKYLKIYRESGHLMSGFNVVMFTVNMISLSFFIQIIFDFFD